MLDEPSNFLDREALGGLAVAIRDWAGAVVSLGPMLLCVLTQRVLCRSSFLITRSLLEPCVRHPPSSLDVLLVLIETTCFALQVPRYGMSMEDD